MPFDAGVIVGRMKLDNRQFVTSMKEINDEQRKTITQTQKTGKSFAGLWKQVAGGYAIVTGVVTAFRGARGLIGSFIDAATESENFRIRLRGLLGSVGEGNRMFDEMREYASKVPFEYREIMEVATQLSGVMEGGVDEVKRWMPLIGDLAAATGFSLQETASQIIRMYSAGAASADMFREKGTLAMLGFQAKVSYSAEATRKKLMEAWKDPASKFKGMTGELATSWKGLMSFLKDAWFNFRVDLMEAGVFDALKSGLKDLLAWIKRLKEEGTLKKWAEDAAEFIKGVFRAIGDTIKAIKEIIKVIGDLKNAFADYLENTGQLMQNLRDEWKKGNEQLDAWIESVKRANEPGVKLSGVIKTLAEWWKETNKIWKESQGETKRVKTSIELLTTALEQHNRQLRLIFVNLEETVLPAYRKWPGLVYNTQEQIKSHVFNANEEIKKNMKETFERTRSLWNEMADGLRTKWASSIGEMLRNIKNWKDGLKKIFDAVVVQFTDMIGQLLSKWATDLIGGLFKSTQKLIGGVAGGAGGGAGGAFGGLGGAAGGIWTGVGSAVGSFLGTFLGGGMSKASQRHIQDLVDAARSTRDMLRVDYKEEVHVIQNLLRSIGDKTKQDITNTWLSKIYDSFSSMISGQHELDMVVDTPTLFMAGDAPVPERVSIQHVGSAAQPAGGKSDITINIPLKLNETEIGMAVGKVSVDLSKRGHFQIHQAGIVNY